MKGGDPIYTRNTNTNILSEEGKTLSGYAIRWNNPSNLIRESGREFTEIIERSAFDTSEAADVVLFYNHMNDMPLARQKGGSLRLTNDPTGLHFEAALPDTSLSNDVQELLRKGILTGEMSFGFTSDDIRWSADKKSRTINHGRLFEISLVINPAYPDTSSSLRNQTQSEINNKREKLAKGNQL